MTRKIFRAILAVALAVLALGLTLTTGALYEYFYRMQDNQLTEKLSLAAAAVEEKGLDYLSSLPATASRLTWVAADGTVLFDSHSNADDMENHAGRSEIAEALEKGEGASVRYSSTRMEKTLYRARRLRDGSVLRLSVSYATIPALVKGLVPTLVLVLTLAFLCSILLARRLSRRIVGPLNELDLDSPLDNAAYDELSPLLTRMAHQYREIDRQKAELAARQSEFLTVIRSMNEGLVLLDRRGVILSVNPAAASFLGLSDTDDCTGRDFLTVERHHRIDKALQKASAEGRGEAEIERGGRVYHLSASRIMTGDRPSGTVLLIVDVTDRLLAERSRREFTANVSHELKTPLQTMMGSAELIENGLVKPEDLPRFAGNIRMEASRLVTLIEDIIRLSRLDEGQELPSEPVELLALAQEEAAAILPQAEARHIVLTVEGTPAVMSGVKPLLHEIMLNLLDNAIKYNREGGRVTVTVGAEGTGVFFSVADTGVGIAAEHQSRVFERFYRVDKSHSRETGGTGLGLSIVKHAVQTMGGTITLQSTPGAGTTITVRFM